MELIEFNFNSSGIRILEKDGEPWFVAKEICEVLNLSDTYMATKSIDDDDKLIQTLFVSGQNRQVTLINESGLYSLVLRSNKPEAKAFKKWVTSEVLPSIRKRGAYLTPDKTDELLKDPDLLIRLATEIKHERNENNRLRAFMTEKNELIKSLSPKAQYYREVLSSPDGIPTTVIAKEHGMSATELHKILNKKGIIYKIGETWVLYQKYQNSGYASTRTHVYYDGEGQAHSKIQLVWTEYGREFIYRLMKGAI